MRDRGCKGGGSRLDRNLQEGMHQLTTIILAFLPRGSVKRIVHYGSTVDGTARSESDIDIAVFVDQNDIWRTKVSGYDSGIDSESPTVFAVNRFINHLGQRLSDSEKYSIYFVTPYDLGFFSFLTERSPKGRLGEAWLRGKSLYCDSRPGWWHNGEGVSFKPTSADYQYRALCLLGLCGFDRFHKK